MMQWKVMDALKSYSFQRSKLSLPLFRRAFFYRSSIHYGHRTVGKSSPHLRGAFVACPAFWPCSPLLPRKCTELDGSKLGLL